MALREVLQFPDARLKRVSEPISDVTDELRELARDMCEVMYDEPGIGLAAPQVGVARRLIVVDTEWTEDDAERNALVVVIFFKSAKTGRFRLPPTSRYTSLIDCWPSGGAGRPITNCDLSVWIRTTYHATESRITPTGTAHSVRPKQ